MRKDRNWLVLVVLLVIGAFLGKVAGELLSRQLPLLAKSYPAGMDPIHFDVLGFLNLTIGVRFYLNVASGIGMLLAILLYRRV
ncbi:MAG: DUF4321 domain-containing protein [Firmicutes bacterium]|nr:DUF4321 domain-containing protein [Bacillota bacterium]MCL5039426.1 DUF4321 domain-containing protein [Bacillota bacterium]